MNMVVADSGRRTTLPFTGHETADSEKVYELFVSDMNQLSGMLAIASVHWKSELEILRLLESQAVEHPGYSEEGICHLPVRPSHLSGSGPATSRHSGG